MCLASSLAGSCPYSTWGFAESIWVQCIHHIKCEHNHPSLGVVGKLVRFCVAVGEGDVQGKYQMWLLNVTCLSINGIAVCALTLGSINALSDNDGALLTPLSSRIVLGLFFLLLLQRVSPNARTLLLEIVRKHSVVLSVGTTAANDGRSTWCRTG